MPSEEVLIECGLTPEDVSAFYRFGEERRYAAQEKLLRKYREILLESVHKDERLISNLDYLLYEIQKKKEN